MPSSESVRGLRIDRGTRRQPEKDLQAMPKAGKANRLLRLPLGDKTKAGKSVQGRAGEIQRGFAVVQVEKARPDKAVPKGLQPQERIENAPMESAEASTIEAGGRLLMRSGYRKAVTPPTRVVLLLQSTARENVAVGSCCSSVTRRR